MGKGVEAPVVAAEVEALAEAAVQVELVELELSMASALVLWQPECSMV